MDAILYVLRTGCEWPGALWALPHDLPPLRTVWWWFRCWREDGTWEAINAAFREWTRVRQGREDYGTGRLRGDDAGKKIGGRRRHRLVGTEGFVLKARVHPTDEPDAGGAKPLLAGQPAAFPRLDPIWVDGDYK